MPPLAAVVYGNMYDLIPEPRPGFGRCSIAKSKFAGCLTMLIGDSFVQFVVQSPHGVRGVVPAQLPSVWKSACTLEGAA